VNDLSNSELIAVSASSNRRRVNSHLVSGVDGVLVAIEAHIGPGLLVGRWLGYLISPCPKLGIGCG
jgi:hypothetical protein